MELKDYLRILRAHWVGVLVLALLGVGAAAAYNLPSPRSTRRPPPATSAPGQKPTRPRPRSPTTLAKSRVKSYVAIATSTTGPPRTSITGLRPQRVAGRAGRPDLGRPAAPTRWSSTISARDRHPAWRPRHSADAWVQALAEGGRRRRRAPDRAAGLQRRALHLGRRCRHARAAADQPQPRRSGCVLGPAPRLRLRAGPPPVRPPDPLRRGGREDVRHPGDRADPPVVSTCAATRASLCVLAVTGPTAVQLRRRRGGVPQAAHQSGLHGRRQPAADHRRHQPQAVGRQVDRRRQPRRRDRRRRSGR